MKSNRIASGIQLGVALAVAGLVGCAQPAKTIYHWEGYQRQLYEHFKGGSGTGSQEQLRLLQAQAEKAQGAGAALPPGFRAHVGLLDLNLGRPDEAKQQFEAEKVAFPESAPYMDFLLRRMNPPAPEPKPEPTPAPEAAPKKPAAKAAPKATGPAASKAVPNSTPKPTTKPTPNPAAPDAPEVKPAKS